MSETSARAMSPAATARVAENRCLAAWAAAAWQARSASYRFAVEHLLIESPQAQAVPTERALARFDAHLATVGTAPNVLEACDGVVVLPGLAVAPQPSTLVLNK
jgi:hypothetical protein